MKISLKNITNGLQQILFVDGTCENVIIDGETTIEENSIFPEERERLCKFFEITPVVQEYKQKQREKPVEKEKGGNE